MEEGYRHTVKSWRRRAEPVGFWPGALLPLLGLLALLLFSCFPLARGWIESPNKTNAEQALKAAGMGWVNVDADGQWLTLRGTPPKAGAGDMAVAVARGALSKTWAGGMHPAATWVSGEFDAVKVAKAPKKPAPKPAAKPAKDADWVFDLHNGILKLTGLAPDQATHDAIVAAAKKQVDGKHITSIDNQLKIGNFAPPEGHLAVAMRGLNGLAKCDTGRTSWTRRLFDFRCELPKANKAAVNKICNAPIELGTIGRVELLVPEEIENCEKQLSAVLSTSHINFTTGSATISPTSNALLDKVAAAAKTCPGTLRVEGHTDNVGKVDFNIDLSKRRAQSTVEALSKRGLDAKRLVAKGFGPNRPIADNNTDAGKAKNRRIEIHVVRSSD